MSDEASPIQHKHPNVQLGDKVRLPRSFWHPMGEVVTVISRRSAELVRVLHDDGQEAIVGEWEPV
jgi:hypothetical protein